MMRLILIAMALILALLPDWAMAQASIPLITTQPTANGGSDYSLSLQILLLMSLLTLLPAALITMTSFTRILIVLAILRQALGTTTTPSNQIILGLALFLSLFIMAPVFDVAYNAALMPYMEEQIGFEDALNVAKEPFREFMFSQTRKTDLALFSDLGNYGKFATEDDVPMVVLLPSFLTSELKTASNWLSAFCALSHYRSRGCRGADVDGDDDVVADAHFAALQAHAVRANRWLDSYHRHISVEFLGDQ